MDCKENVYFYLYQSNEYMLDFTQFMSTPLAIFIYTSIMVLIAFFMEVVAWFLHKYVMHGFGWYLHEDHHRASKGFFEKNDIFALFFSVLSCLLIVFGINGNEFNLLFWLGIGVGIYGIGYFFFHEILFHKRIRNKYRPKTKYMKRIFNYHAYHHQTTNGKEPGKAYSFLYAPKQWEDFDD